MRYPKSGTYQDGAGNVLVSGTVSVYLADTTTAASIYTASSGGSAVNSVTTASNGGYLFYIDTKDYLGTQRFDIKLTKTDYSTVYLYNQEILPDLSGVTDPYRDPRADGALGDGSTDDKTALDLTFANAVIQFPEGTFMGYDLSLSGVNTLTGMGQGSIIKCNSLAAAYVIGFTGSGQSTLYIDKLVVDGNKALGTFTGAGAGVDIRGYDEVNIGWLEVKNAWGHGLTIADCAKVNIDTLIVHDNYKYGAVFSDNVGVGAAEEITIGTLISYDNGADSDGIGVGNDYSGISFSDNASASIGSRRIVIGKVLAHGNARDGIAFGVNATSSETGPTDIMVGEILSYSNSNYGVEFYGIQQGSVGSIIVHSNAYSGVYIAHGDLSPGPEAYSEDISIGTILSYNNTQHGVHILGARKLHIDSIIAKNNSQAGAGTYDGVFIDEAGAVQVYHNTDIVIDKLHAYDDQGTATQQYGLNVKQILSEGRNYVRHFTASGNSAGDYNLTWPSSVFNPINLNGKWHSIKTTTDATASVVAFKSNPMPANTIWLCEAVVMSVDSATGNVRGLYHFEGAYRKHGAGAIATFGSSENIHSAVETDAGLDAVFATDGVDRVTVAVTGKAATTMTWKVYFTLDEIKAY